MTAVVQRVTHAAVAVGGERIAAIQAGLLILLGVEKGDTAADAAALADKCVRLRIFEDDSGKMNRAADACGAAILVVPNFTLCASAAKGNRPSFDRAEAPDLAEPMTALFAERCRAGGLHTETGRFGADMQVTLTNDGPVTLIIRAENGRVV